MVNGKCLSCNSTPKTNPQSKPHSTPKTNPQPKTHNEDKEATRALIATILIISFFLILALIGIYSDESSPNYAENVTDTYNYYDDTIDSSLYKTNSIFTPMSTIDKNELSENKQEISIENIETNVDEPEKPSETIKTEVKKSTPVTTSPVATGDDTKQEFWYALLGLSISTLLLLLIKHYKTRRE